MENLKATLAGFGEGGSCYYNLKPFSSRELWQHFGHYFFNGLAPSTRVEQKFKPQSQDLFHGNDFIYHMFGPNDERRHRHFKTLLEIQDPEISTPSRKKYLNWKVRPLVQWMAYLFPLIWLLGACFSIDETKIGFQGMHVDKKRVTYKSEGGGFQVDALCEDGLCFQFYFRNDPENVEYTKTRLLPLHSRVMTLFDSVENNYHVCIMENLYSSVMFCKRAWNHKRKFKVHGVTRKGMRGVTGCVVQEE